MELGLVNFYCMKQQRGKCMKSFLKTTRDIKLTYVFLEEQSVRNYK
jgi:hypothetical protein